jgi:hypothetical protein
LRKLTYVIMWTRHNSPPPPRPRTPIARAIPRWHQLTPQLQDHLLIQLTTLLLQHVHAAPRGTEVDDDNP